MTPSTSDKLGVTGRVRVRSYDVETLGSVEPRFEKLSPESKRQVTSYCEPLRDSQGHNVILDQWFDELTTAMDLGEQNTISQPNEFAVGDDDTPEDSDDTELENEVFRGDLDTQSGGGDDYTATGFLDSGEANDHTIREVGLVADGLFVNRSTDFPEEDKTSGIVITINFTITYDNA